MVWTTLLLHCRAVLVSVVGLALCSPALAWNALGHKVIADIAWRELSDPQRKEIVDILKRHPRFAEDFARDMPSEDTDCWIFQHAAVWPDIARGIKGPDRDKFDKPIWHYVNHPLTIDGFMAPMVNLQTDPKKGKSISWNVRQATNFCIGIIKSDAPPQQKALAYSWIMHLVGDMHQPMHSTALFCDRFPKGDRGGNSIKLVQGDNLHSLWDNLFGRAHKPNDVQREVADILIDRSAYTAVNSHTDVEGWVQESNDIATEFAYSPEILLAASTPGAMERVNLPDEYLRKAGKIARQRAVAAGLRLGVILGAKPQQSSVEIARERIKREAEAAKIVDTSIVRPRTVTRPPVSYAAPVKDHWLNTKTSVRHNSGCRHYGDTVHGRYCTGSDGKACGICGG